MSAILFDGKTFASRKIQSLKPRIARLIKKGIRPTLASVFLPVDPGSALYTKIKGAAARELGIDFSDYPIKNPQDVGAIVATVAKLSDGPKITGILVQKPAGRHGFPDRDWAQIVSAIDPAKDVDGLSPQNLGLLAMGAPRFLPATVAAVLEILAAGKIKVGGNHVVIVGSSEILGKPLASMLMFLEKNATVTLLHRGTKNLASYARGADILISATGVAGLIRGSMVKSGAAVIDVGAPKGDVVTDEVAKKAAFLSPVPGGVGPVTVFSLLENTVLAAERQLQE